MMKNNMENKEKVFIDGMRFEAPNEAMKEKTPWIKGKISIKVPDFINFLNKYNTNSGWINIDLKKSKEKGTLYLELNQWKPKEELDLGMEEPKVEDHTAIDPMTGKDLNVGDIPF